MQVQGDKHSMYCCCQAIRIAGFTSQTTSKQAAARAGPTPCRAALPVSMQPLWPAALARSVPPVGSRSSVRAIVVSSVKASGDLQDRQLLVDSIFLDNSYSIHWRDLTGVSLHRCSQLCETHLLAFVARASTLPLAPSSSGSPRGPKACPTNNIGNYSCISAHHCRPTLFSCAEILEWLHESASHLTIINLF